MWTNIIIKAKKSIAVLFVFVAALLIGAFTSLQQSTAYADDAVEFHQVGASVRMGDELGIRFSATIDKVDATSKYYVMIIPETWVETYNLDEEGNEDYYDVLYKAGMRSEIDKQENEEISMIVMQCEPTYQASGEYKDLYLIRGSIVNVKYENSNTNFFGVAFEQKADGTRVYADRQEEYSYRNIANIASAALNDSEANYSEENIASLNKMVKDAYNVSLGNSEDAQVELPEMSVHSYSYLSVQNGSTYQASVQGLPDVGIKVDWSLESSKDFKSTIDQNGKITVLDQDITLTGHAKVLGEDIKFAVNPTAKPATGVLEDFASGSTRYSFGSGGTVGDGQVPHTATLADIGGVTANGLAGRPIWRSSDLVNKDATFRFALSAEDLKATISEAEKITVRMMVGTYYRSGNVINGNKITAQNYTYDSAEKGNVKFVGIEFNVPHNTWVDLTVTKTEFLNFFKGETEADKLNNFSTLGANNGTGIAGFTVCESYTINGAAADCEMLFDAIYTDKATVESLASSKDVSRVEVIEDVNAKVKVEVKNGTYLASKTDSKGNMAEDVVYVTEYQNYGVAMRFKLTAEELSKITSLTFNVLLEPSVDTTKTSYGLRYNRGGGATATGLVQQSVTCGVWTTITYTKEQLCQKFLYPTDNGVKNENCSADNGWTDFCNAFCSTGDFTKWFLSGVTWDNPPTIYIAGVTFNYS